MIKSFNARLCAMGARLAAAGVLLASLAACGGQGSGPAFVPVGAPTAAALATGPGTVPPTTAAPPPPAASTPASAVPAPAGAAPTTMPTPTLKEQIAALERSGGYPKLDRSSDIVGPDVNKNGVRDDIEAWLNTLQVSDAQRKALMQDARATQRTLVVDLKDKAALQRTGEGLTASTNCGGDNFSPYATWSSLAGKIEAMTANTKERAVRYMQYNAARSGSSTTLPDGNTCEP